MYWLRWHYHLKDIAGAPYKIKKRKKEKKRKTKQQNRRQSVVAGRQQLYCAVQSRSPSHCQTTTGKVQSSARDGTSSATVHSWQTTAFDVPRTCRSHWEGTVTECWTSNGRYHQHGWVSRASEKMHMNMHRRSMTLDEFCTWRNLSLNCCKAEQLN